MEQIDNVDNQLMIDGQSVILKTTRSEPITQLKADEGFKCKFYCVCEDTKLVKNIHPFYGTTDIVTDTSLFDCDECEERAETYCVNVGRTCKPKIFTESVFSYSPSILDWTPFASKESISLRKS